MLNKNIRRAALVILPLALLIGSCGDSSGSATTDHAEAEEHAGEFHFGEPADAAEADRVVEITATDGLRFEPAEFSVRAGEIITFRVMNPGSLPHDFTLGDQETQDAHEIEMAEMMESGQMEMHDEANAISLPPGETKELTWHFTEATTVLIGCHQTGHYAAGMTGTVTVE